MTVDWWWAGAGAYNILVTVRMVTMGILGIIVMMGMMGMIVMMWMMGVIVTMWVTQVTAPRQPRRTPGQQQLFRG